jgi:hypothetical protein
MEVFYSYALLSCSQVEALSGPLTVEKGDIITVSLEYDLTNSITIYDSRPVTSSSNAVQCTNTSPSFCFGNDSYFFC